MPVEKDPNTHRTDEYVDPRAGAEDRTDSCNFQESKYDFPVRVLDTVLTELSRILVKCKY